MMVLAVLGVAVLATWDEQREANAALDDFAREQTTIADSVASEVALRLDTIRRDGLLIAEASDTNGALVKKFSLHGSSFKKVNGHWRLEKMGMRDYKKHSQTEMKFDTRDE